MSAYVPYVQTGKKTNNNNNNSNYQSHNPTAGNTYTSHSTAGGSYLPGASSSTSNTYQTSNVYQPSSTSTSASTYQPSSGVYQPSSTSSYQPSSTNTAYSSSYQPSSTYSPTNTYSTYKPVTATTTSSNAASTLPDFSMALDVPPPSQPPASAAATAPAPSNSYSTSHKGTVTSDASTYNPYANLPPATNPSYSSQSTPSAVAVPVSTTTTNTYTTAAGGGYGAGYNTASASPVVASAGSAMTSNNYKGGPTGGIVTEGNPVNSDKLFYEIKGYESQLVEIELDPQKTVIAEAGAMLFLDNGIDFKTKFGDGSEPKQGFWKKLLSAGGRLLMGESLFITHFQNQGSTKARVAFAAPYPGTILPMNLQELPGGKIICQKDAFLCAALGTKLTMHFNKRIGSGLFGGEGFILQRLEGDGLAFVHAGGMVIRRELHNEKLRLDTGCLVAFTEGIDFDIQFVPGLKSMFFGGEGLFLATLQGTGTVWLQSLPFSRFADRIIQHAPSIGGRRQGEGSALTGGFGDLVNGDGFGFNF